MLLVYIFCFGFKHANVHPIIICLSVRLSIQRPKDKAFNISLYIFACRPAMFSRLTQGVSSVLHELSGEERSDGDSQVSIQILIKLSY